MKPKTYLKAVVFTLTSLTTLSSSPVFAADATNRSIDRSATSDRVRSRRDHTSGASQTETSTTSQSEKSLGQVERANKLIGKTIIGSDNQKLGKIDNLVLDLESGHILYAVVGTGGVLGAGELKVAVPPGAFSQAEANNFHVNVDKQKLVAAPQFTKDIDKETELGKAEFVSKVYQYFGQNAWWHGARAADEGSFNNVHKASELLGMKVQNSNNQPMGKVENAAVDLPAGRVVYVILNPDSSLNLGNNLYAMPPNALTLSPDHKTLNTGIDKEKLAGAPHFTKDNWQNLSDSTYGSQVYEYYGKQAYFRSSGNLQPTGRNDSKNN